VTEPATDIPWTPFPDVESVHFELTKVVNQSQLHSELETALDQSIQLATSKTPGDEFGTLWLVPGGLDKAVIQRVIDDHVPEQEWGVPQSTRDYFALLRKVSEDPEADLTTAEVQTAIKGLLLRSRS
jgi:hypothetical protein